MFPVKPVPDNNVKKPDLYVFKDMDDYIANGQNIDKKYAEYRQQKKSPEQPLLIERKTTVDTEKLTVEHLWLKGKRVKHKKFGIGTVNEISGSQNGEIRMTVLFEKEENERQLGYKACVKNNLIEIL